MFLMGEAEFCHIWIGIEQSGHLVRRHPSPESSENVTRRWSCDGRVVLLFKKQAFNVQVHIFEWGVESPAVKGTTKMAEGNLLRRLLGLRPVGRDMMTREACLASGISLLNAKKIILR